jgi:multiple antibiotic resistance protein
MHDILSAFLLVYAGLFPVVNPLGAAPIFLSLTDGCSEAERSRLAAAVAFNSFCLLLGSLLLGSLILEFFGITIPVVRVAGGLLVAAMGWRLINDADATTHRKLAEAGTGSQQSFYPLTLPLTVGPGSIAVAITYGSHRPSIVDLTVTVAAAIAGLLAISATVYVCYRFAEQLSRALGPSGINVLIRLSAFILICIGIQICWSGFRELVASL